METGRVTDVEALLAHAPFVRGLAVALLPRDGRVEDLVQDTWRVAIERRPGPDGSLRAWLGGVVRNLALTLRRRDAVRARTPVRPAARDLTPIESAEREEIRRRLAGHVSRLREPYRSVILLRFYEDLPPREIARLLDVPVETVRTRIRRGLAEIRSRLHAECGGRQRARAVLGMVGGGAMASAKAKVAGLAGIVLLVCGGAVLLQMGSGVAPDADPGIEPPPPLTDGAVGVGPAAALPNDWRQAAPRKEGDSPADPADAPSAPPSAAPTAPTPPTAPKGVVAGRVIDQRTGEPVSGVTVTLARPRGKRITTETDADGRYRFEEVANGWVWVTGVHSDYAPATHSGLRLAGATGFGDVTLGLVGSLEKTGGIEGHVIDRDGRPVPGTMVVVHSVHSQLRLDLHTDESGFFTQPRLLPGWYSVSVPGEEEDADLYKRRRNILVKVGEVARVEFSGSGDVTGVVRDEEGTPIPKTRISLDLVDMSKGPKSLYANTDAEGHFRFENAGIGDHRIWIYLPGGNAMADVVNLSGNEQEIEVRLPTGGIRGTVRFPEPKPKGRVDLRLFPLLPAADGQPPKPGGYPAGHAWTNPQGEFRFRGLHAGLYRILVYRMGKPTIHRDVEVQEGRVTEDVVVDLE